jgi:hypothetical protein
MTFVHVANPVSIPSETSLKKDTHWIIHDFKYDSNTICTLQGQCISYTKALHLIRNGIVEGRATNPTIVSISEFRNTNGIVTIGTALLGMTAVFGGLTLLAK